MFSVNVSGDVAYEGIISSIISGGIDCSSSHSGSCSGDEIGSIRRNVTDGFIGSTSATVSGSGDGADCVSSSSSSSSRICNCSGSGDGVNNSIVICGCF